MPRRSTGGHIAVDLKPIYRAPSREAAWAAFEEFEEKWGTPYPAIGQLWRNAWEQFVPFLDYDAEIRTVLCSTNAIESLNARYRRAVTVRGHLPTEQAAMKCLYLVTRSLDPKGTGQTRWTMRWKPALNAFAITFGDRMPKAEKPLMRTAAYTVSRTDPRPAPGCCHHQHGSDSSEHCPGPEAERAVPGGDRGVDEPCFLQSGWQLVGVTRHKVSPM